MVTEKMKIRKLIKYYILGESLKEIELNRILDKISKKIKLTKREKNFLDLYQTTREDEMKDFMLLSKNSTCNKITSLLEDGKKIICDLADKNGKFGLTITKIDNNYEDDYSVITMRGGETHILEDKYLYNIIYNENKDNYSLKEHDEYQEKLEVNNDDN